MVSLIEHALLFILAFFFHLHQPQPSDDPCDPLNWSTIKKNSYFAALLYATALGGVVGPLFVPSFGDMSVEFGVPLSLIAQLNGDMILGLGISS